MPGKLSRRSTTRAAQAALALAALVAIAALGPAQGMGAATRSSDGALSPRLAELARPAVRSAPRGEQARRLSLPPAGAGSLLREGNRVLADVRFEQRAAAGIEELRAAGARIVHISRRYQTVTVAMRLADLPALAEVPRVGGVTEILTPIVSSAGDPPPTTSTGHVCFGAATSEGDVQLRAAEARSAFNLDGAGVTVGVLSDSFGTASGTATTASGDVASGDLPGPGNPCGRHIPVNVLEDYTGPDPAPSDEGRAMAQIVHDLAPGASLAFATAFKGELSFAENIRRLARSPSEGGAGASVIVDDVIYLDEPFFQDGRVAVAVNDVTADDVTYFSSAGNNNLIDKDGNDIASWETAAFRLAAGCPPGLTVVFAYVEDCLDFDPDSENSDPTYGITVANGASLLIVLQWAEPWSGVTTDLDAYLLNSSGNPIEVDGSPVRSENANATVTRRPFELIAWENDTGLAQQVQLVINRCDQIACDPVFGGGTDSPRVKLLLFQNGSGVTATEYPESSGDDIVGPTIYGHNGAAAAMSLGAIRFNTASAPEAFSSRGPVTHYFGPVTGPIPAPPLGSPHVIAKPDVVATNGGANTFFGQLVSGVWRFFGTSAAAPHAVAVAALMRQANPALSTAQVRAGLTSTARPVGAFGPTAVGSGLVDAFGAVGAILGLPPADSDAGSLPQSIPPAPAAFVDQTRPRAFFRQRPPKVVRTRFQRARVVFRFRSDKPGVRFICRLDGGPWRFCGARYVKRLRVGPHVLRVKARDAAGNTTRRAAVHRFRIVRVGRR